MTIDTERIESLSIYVNFLLTIGKVSAVCETGPERVNVSFFSYNFCLKSILFIIYF